MVVHDRSLEERSASTRQTQRLRIEQRTGIKFIARVCQCAMVVHGNHIALLCSSVACYGLRLLDLEPVGGGNTNGGGGQGGEESSDLHCSRDCPLYLGSSRFVRGDIRDMALW